MRDLSHQISVCAAAWPGGQQEDGWEQPLAGDILRTHWEDRGEGLVEGRGDGEVVDSGEREIGKDRQSCSLLFPSTWRAECRGKRNGRECGGGWGGQYRTALCE